MAIGSLIALLLIGLVAGWLAGKLMRGSGFGLVGNIAVGIVGAFVDNQGQDPLSSCNSVPLESV